MFNTHFLSERSFKRLAHARERWWHEDHLINQRLTWLLTSETLLFAALAWLIPLRSSDDKWIWIIIGSGIAVAFVVYFGIRGAKQAQDDLLIYCPPIRSGINAKSRMWGTFAAQGFPFIFIAAWIFAIGLLYIVNRPGFRGGFLV